MFHEQHTIFNVFIFRYFGSLWGKKNKFPVKNEKKHMKFRVLILLSPSSQRVALHVWVCSLMPDALTQSQRCLCVSGWNQTSYLLLERVNLSHYIIWSKQYARAKCFARGELVEKNKRQNFWNCHRLKSNNYKLFCELEN